MTLRVGVLVSGQGTNLQALIDAAGEPGYPAEVVLVGCNRAEAPALQRAARAGLAVCLADRAAIPRRSDRQNALRAALEAARVELVVLAGYDEVLSPEFVAAFAGRMLNTHPSLLPAFGGTMHAVAQALEAGVKVTGCTVHLVTDEVDGGPILLQRCVDVLDDDTLETLRARIQAQEHLLLPAAVRACAEGRVFIEGGRARVIASVERREVEKSRVESGPTATNDPRLSTLESRLQMRAIISVYDKTGIVDFARGLEELGFEVFSTGGTESLLREAGLSVRGVQEITGFPEMLGGRVKTLHPAVHGGILALRDDPGHLEELARQGLQPIDVVVANLYPFLEVARQAASRMSVALENIDVGGHTLLRAAAKNFAHVLAVCDPADYPRLLEDLRRPEGVSLDARRRLAAKAFQHCAVYDSHVSTYLRPHDELFPTEYTIALTKLTNLRAGENPHQLAAFYAESSPRPRPNGLASAQQLHGKEPSFNNTYDADLAWQTVSDFTSTCVAIVKHANLCGLSLGDSVADAYRRALATDPQTAFGSAVACNRIIDEEAAHEIAAVFFEDLVAPGYTREALQVLRAKQDLRLFATQADQGTRGVNGSSPMPGELDYKRVLGGFLVQTRDALPEQSFTPRVATQRQPNLDELTSLLFAWRAVKHSTSNAVMLAKGRSLVGFGVGQPSRLDAVDLACRKAGERAQGSVLASDGFFPFPDAVERAAAAGVTAIIQPGGSTRDPELIRLANRAGMAMIFTSERHYRH